jgi:hypothetical protein
MILVCLPHERPGSAQAEYPRMHNGTIIAAGIPSSFSSTNFHVQAVPACLLHPVLTTNGMIVFFPDDTFTHLLEWCALSLSGSNIN